MGLPRSQWLNNRLLNVKPPLLTNGWEQVRLVSPALLCCFQSMSWYAHYHSSQLPSLHYITCSVRGVWQGIHCRHTPMHASLLGEPDCMEITGCQENTQTPHSLCEMQDNFLQWANGAIHQWTVLPQQIFKLHNNKLNAASLDHCLSMFFFLCLVANTDFVWQ